MSKIIIPSKPSWRIVLDVDDRGQIQMAVEDRQPGPIAFRAGPARQLNQIELASIFTSAVMSILQTTLSMRNGRQPNGKEKTNNASD